MGHNCFPFYQVGMGEYFSTFPLDWVGRELFTSPLGCHGGITIYHWSASSVVIQFSAGCGWGVFLNFSCAFWCWAVVILGYHRGCAGCSSRCTGVFFIAMPGVVPSLPAVASGAHASTSISELDFEVSLLTIIISLLERSRWLLLQGAGKRLLPTVWGGPVGSSGTGRWNLWSTFPIGRGGGSNEAALARVTAFLCPHPDQFPHDG